MSRRDDQVDRQVDELLTAMVHVWAEAPPTVRWRALRELSESRASLQAMTVHQLLPETTEEGTRRGVGAVARALGVTTSWISQLAAMPSKHSGLFSWGRALALATELVALAERAPSTRLSDELAGIVRRGLHDTSPRHDLESATSRWAMAARRQRRGPEADVLVDRIDALLVDVTPSLDLDWLARAEIAIGYQTARGPVPRGEDVPRPALAPAGPPRPSATVPTARQAEPEEPPASQPRSRRGTNDPLPWSRYRLRDR
ncbi:hypothetical protein [Pseudofrankia inefficax]|nr:hypothetical protein [Pseudofrankia inefficax]